MKQSTKGIMQGWFTTSVLAATFIPGWFASTFHGLQVCLQRFQQTWRSLRHGRHRQNRRL